MSHEQSSKNACSDFSETRGGKLRSLFKIMGTFIYHGSSYFWRNVKDYASLHGNEVVCWKFLVILYRILQDGQGNAIKDSLEEIPFIGESF